ncbi:hypothetical protein LDBUL1632_00118 [Lactobacillus delbrueckii subsp. bulgaricus CNCM I-1632]|nr:hypothetical protein BBD26_1260 [Lactobacillus delbrueckii subsp. bulgaricus]EHE91383.1 hypothetical protein LDBUL1632_00118 [Lactobacillus delbrueckii subsp. bulgaricus CNCM I-1632]
MPKQLPRLRKISSSLNLCFSIQILSYLFYYNLFSSFFLHKKAKKKTVPRKEPSLTSS